VKATKSEDEEHVALQQALQKFLDIAVQDDPSTIVPPYFELDCNEKTISDLSVKYKVSELDSIPSLKMYFSRLSSRNDQGGVSCSMILAQNITFNDFMEKARLHLINLDFGIFPKACDHEETSKVGWLLYSTCQQDEEHMSELLSSLVQETVGTKWHPIRTNDRYKKAQEPNSTHTYALHLEAAIDKAGKLRQEFSEWYGSSSQLFPDGTKLQLVPPFNSIL
jgi:hypothetical protein